MKLFPAGTWNSIRIWKISLIARLLESVKREEDSTILDVINKKCWVKKVPTSKSVSDILVLPNSVERKIECKQVQHSVQNYFFTCAGIIQDYLKRDFLCDCDICFQAKN